MAVAMMNSAGQFLSWISITKAATLLVLGEATPVGAVVNVLRSPSVEVEVTRGVMLNRRAQKYIELEQAFTRDKMLRRDNYSCQYCGTKKGKMTVDHVLPQSRGGATSWDNCVAACQPCNGKKDNMTPEEANMKLLAKPKRPRIADDSEIWNLILDDSIPMPSSLMIIEQDDLAS